LGEKRVVGVLLDGEDGQLNGDTEFGASKKESMLASESRFKLEGNHDGEWRISLLHELRNWLK
jgi:hypothetical protein